MTTEPQGRLSIRACLVLAGSAMFGLTLFVMILLLIAKGDINDW